MTTSPFVRITGLSMSFEGVNVIRDASLSLYPGEVCALIGENGAGKSTMLKILGGIYEPLCGNIEVEGKTMSMASPQNASALGIALIHQEPLAFPDLTVAENIFVGAEPKKWKYGWVDWKTMHQRTKEVLGALEIRLDPKSPMHGLSVADRQMVDVAAALTQNAKLLMMDEPTASLTPNEVERLFGIIRRLRDQGTSIVFVSHRLEEIFEIADRIVVMRDGEVVGERLPKQTNTDEIIRMMVGRSLDAMYEKPKASPGNAKVLEVQDLHCKGHFRSISFDLKAGEIVGLAGLVGSGRSSLAKALFGILAIDRGAVMVGGEAVSIRSSRDAIGCGFAYIPEDRQRQGLLMPASVTQNISLSALSRLSRHGWTNKAQERMKALGYVEQLRIALHSVDQQVAELSGGNQQKVVLSKWLLNNPRIIILDEPTHGIDVGAKAEVHHLMAKLASEGIAILMISSELPEVIAMSDRVIVMREGAIVGRFERSEISQERIMAAATGQLR
jgi:ABC-type sugar transport system ATPase subunit